MGNPDTIAEAMTPDQRNANEIIAESLLAIDRQMTDIAEVMEQQSEVILDIGRRLGRIEGENLFAIETIVDRLEKDQLPHITESLAAIEGRLACIEKVQHNLKIAVDMIIQYLVEETNAAEEGRLEEDDQHQHP